MATLYRQPGRLNIVDQVRKAMCDSGETEYGIAKARRGAAKRGQSLRQS